MPTLLLGPVACGDVGSTSPVEHLLKNPQLLYFSVRRQIVLSEEIMFCRVAFDQSAFSLGMFSSRSAILQNRL